MTWLVGMTHKRRCEKARGVDVGVAMHRAEADELSAFKAGDHPKHAVLFGLPKLGLETDQAVDARISVFLTKLDDCVGPSARSGVGQSDGFHRAVGEGVASAPRDFFHRQASLEVSGVFFLIKVQVGDLGGEQRGDERFVLLASHRAVEIGGLPFVVTRLAEDLAVVDALGVNRRRDGIEEVQVLRAGDLANALAERGGSERASRDNAWPVVRNLGYLFAYDFDVGITLDCFGNGTRKRVAVHAQRVASGNCRPLGALQHERSQRPHLLLEQTVGSFGVVGLQRA